MAQITAALVNELRNETGLPMMDCKKALTEAGGDKEKAKETLRKNGIAIAAKRSDRETAFGRFGIYHGVGKKAGAVVELKCESAPVAGSAEFRQFAGDIAKQLASNKNVKTADELLKLPSLSKPGQTLGDQKDDMFNRIREVFELGRIVRFDGPSGGYAHHDGGSGAIVEVTGGTNEAAKDVAMHVVAQKPQVVKKEDLEAAAVDKEREILSEAARKEGKPENIIAKMVEGRLKNFFAEKVLLEQPFVKDDTKTVGKIADEAKMKVLKFVRWELGKE